MRLIDIMSGFLRPLCFSIVLVLAVFPLHEAAGETSFANEGPGLMGDITLPGSIQTALENNLDLRLSKNSVESGQIGVSSAKSVFLPDLSANASLSEKWSGKYDAASDHTDRVSSDSFDTSLKSSLLLFNGMANVNGLKKARSDLGASELEYARLQDSVIYETASAFLQVSAGGEMIQVARDRLETKAKELERVEAFYKSGKRPVSDFLQQKADIAQAEQDLLDAERDFDAGKLSLLQLMGIQSKGELTLADPGRDRLMEKFQTGLKEPELGEALASRADYLAQKKRLESGELGLKTAKAGRWPTVNLSATAGSNYSSAVENLDFDRQYGEVNPYLSVGVNASVPIFDKKSTRNEVAQARTSLSNQDIALRSLELEISNQLRLAWLDYQKSLKARKTAEARLEYASQALEAARARYDVGLITYIELSQARSDELEAAYNKIKSDYDVLLAGLNVLNQSGEIVDALEWME